MTDRPEYRFYQGEAGRVPWMKRDTPRIHEIQAAPDKKFILILAWAAIASVAKDIVRRRADDNY